MSRRRTAGRLFMPASNVKLVTAATDTGSVETGRRRQAGPGEPARAN